MVVDPAVQVVVAAAATVVATAAIGVYHRTTQILLQVKEHNRILFGEDAVDDWDGIVPMVQEHRDALDDHGLLDEDPSQ